MPVRANRTTLRGAWAGLRAGPRGAASKGGLIVLDGGDDGACHGIPGSSAISSSARVRSTRSNAAAVGGWSAMRPIICEETGPISTARVPIGPPAQVGTQAGREVRQPGLGGAVGGQPGEGGDPGQRGDVDEVAAATNGHAGYHLAAGLATGRAG